MHRRQKTTTRGITTSEFTRTRVSASDRYSNFEYRSDADRYQKSVSWDLQIPKYKGVVQFAKVIVVLLHLNGDSTYILVTLLAR